MEKGEVIRLSEILVKELETGYSGSSVLHGVSLEITNPGIYLVLGRNGSGKTTLFRAIAGLLEPYQGRVTVNGFSTFYEVGIKKEIAFLSHKDGLPEGYTVRSALNIFAKLEGVGKERVEEMVEFAEIEELGEKYVGKLSQGQRRRVALAKSLLADKSIYIMDEPTANLDPKAASDIRNLLRDISRNKIVLYSSHNLYEAHELSSMVLLLDNGELKFYGNIDSISSRKSTIGIRADGVESVYPDALKQGPYYIMELDSLDRVQDIIDRLGKEGIRIKEIREMNNPLEEFFE